MFLLLVGKSKLELTIWEETTRFRAAAARAGTSSLSHKTGLTQSLGFAEVVRAGFSTRVLESNGTVTSGIPSVFQVQLSLVSM